MQTKRQVDGQTTQLRLSGLPVVTIARVDMRTVVANIGLGPALNLRLVNEKDQIVDSISGLGIGQRESLPPVPYSDSAPHFLYYHDLWSRWHSTTLMAPPFVGDADNMSYRLTFRQGIGADEIPSAVLKSVDTRTTMDILNEGLTWQQPLRDYQWSVRATHQ